MRHVRSNVLLLILLGTVLLLMLLGGGAGLASFLLLREGYSFPVWGLLPFLTLLLVALVLSAVVWWIAGGTLPGLGRGDGAGQPGAPEEGPRGGPNRGDEV